MPQIGKQLKIIFFTSSKNVLNICIGDVLNIFVQNLETHVWEYKNTVFNMQKQEQLLNTMAITKKDWKLCSCPKI